MCGCSTQFYCSTALLFCCSSGSRSFNFFASNKLSKKLIYITVLQYYRSRKYKIKIVVFNTGKNVNFEKYTGIEIEIDHLNTLVLQQHEPKSLHNCGTFRTGSFTSNQYKRKNSLLNVLKQYLSLSICVILVLCLLALISTLSIV